MFEAFLKHIGNMLGASWPMLDVFWSFGGFRGSWGHPGHIMAPRPLKWRLRRGQDGFWEDLGREDASMLGALQNVFPSVFHHVC